MGDYILALDQGTTSSRAILFDKAGNIAGKGQHTFPQYYPKQGWVEHDPEEIWETQRQAAAEAVNCVPDAQVLGIGVTNQRETTIVWDKLSGKPVYNAIVWQCRRTAPLCEELKADGLAGYIRDTTGLLIDAYFSGTKLRWILDNVPGARARAERGELLFGTADPVQAMLCRVPVWEGLWPACVGTARLVALTTLLAVVPGVGCGLYLAELASPRQKRIFDAAVDMLAGMPSIVMGLFGFMLILLLRRTFFPFPVPLYLN